MIQAMSTAITRYSQVNSQRQRRSLPTLLSTLALAFLAQVGTTPVLAKPSQRDSVVTPARNPPARLLDPADAIIVLIDHQTALSRTVRDITPQELRDNTIALVRLAALARIPVIVTTSDPYGPNGPPIPEIRLNAPGAAYVARKTEVSAWDSPEFVKAVRATGRRTLVMAGTWTSVRVALPAIQAKAEGFNVYVVIDASGDTNHRASQVGIERMSQLGIVPLTTNMAIAESQRAHAGPGNIHYTELLAETTPSYRAILGSFKSPQAGMASAPTRPPDGALRDW